MLDIKEWLEYTDKIKHGMELWLKSSKENGFWQRVEFDFQMTVYSSISYSNTSVEDLKMVKAAIETNSITEREVSLLRKIGCKANEYNNEYPRTYKSEKRYWHDYGNPDFEIVEKMYAKVRLRNVGIGYRKIAAVLDIPRDKVRNYCKANGLDGYAKRLVERKNREQMRNECPEISCKQCGKPLKAETAGRKRVYCSEKCRKQWAREHPTLYMGF